MRAHWTALCTVALASLNGCASVLGLEAGELDTTDSADVDSTTASDADPAIDSTSDDTPSVDTTVIDTTSVDSTMPETMSDTASADTSFVDAVDAADTTDASKDAATGDTTLVDAVDASTDASSTCHSLIIPGATGGATAAVGAAGPGTGSACYELWGKATPSAGVPALLLGGGKNSASEGQFALYCYPGLLGFEWIDSVVGGGVSLDVAASCDDGSWHHFAACRDVAGLGQMTLFIDGRKVGAKTGKMVTSTGVLTVGGWPLNPTTASVQVAEVRVSSTLRYTAAFTPSKRFTTDASTVTLYHFDESSGATSADASGNGHTLATPSGIGWATTCHVCSDTKSDAMNCGACGYSCRNGRSCVASRCTPAWQALPAGGAPSARVGSTAGTYGGKYYVFGGAPVLTGALADGGVYDPVANTWAAMPALKSARCGHAAVSANNKIYTFGGLTDCSNGTTIGPGLEAFDGTSWSTVSTSGAPSARYAFSMSWTGTELFIYGGSNNVSPALATGARFLPGSSSWTDASCALTGCERGGDFSAFFDAGVMRIWAGGPYGSAPAGLQYDLASKVWSAWTVPTGTPASIPQARADDGRRIYVLRDLGTCPAGGVEVQVYDRKSNSWTSDTASAPTGMSGKAAAMWIGGELFAFSGSCGASPSAVGGRYQPPAP